MLWKRLRVRMHFGFLRRLYNEKLRFHKEELTYGVAAFVVFPGVCNCWLTIYTDFLVVMQPPILVESA